MHQDPGGRISQVAARMAERLAELERDDDPARHFLATYRRVTLAVGQAADRGRVEDPAWLARWDVAFAELYLQALDTWCADPGAVPGPWREAFGAPAGLEPYLHVLLGMNAHINYDMPQSLLRVVSEADRHDPVLMASRERDHHALDGVIVALVPQESRHLVRAAARAPGVLDRLLLPLSRAASAKLLREGREQVWATTDVLMRARAAGPEALAAATARLEAACRDRVHDLLVPRHPLYHLARHGFGVRLEEGEGHPAEAGLRGTGREA